MRRVQGVVAALTPRPCAWQLACALLAAIVLAAPAAAAPSSKVWFLQGEQLIAVNRAASTPEATVRALLSGPTAAERKRGIRTYIPARTAFNGLTIENGLATVDVGLRFALGGDAASLDARLTQLARTVLGFKGVTRMQLLVDGGVPLGIFPGIVTARPITLKYLLAPSVRPWKPPPRTPGAPVAGLKAIQDRLVSLGFMLSADADGKDGPQTQTAVLAFQKWEGLAIDGVIGPQTRSRLGAATRPRPLTSGGSGKRAEVLLKRQVVLAIANNQVVRVIPVSSGKPSTPTPPGDFKVYAKFPKWWSTPFREWLLWALPFNGGIAFHEFPEVPPYPASHGCVRQLATTARWLYDFSFVGMPVKVIAR